jgi:uncharacterized membrane protein YkvA (DUF1232 family)
MMECTRQETKMTQPLEGEILAVTDPSQPRMAEDMAQVEQGLWPKLKRVMAKLPFAEDVIAAFYCARDPHTPLKARAALMAALVYFIAPVDAIPDFIAVLGYTDDASVLLGVMAVMSAYVTPGHRQLAKAKISELAETA